MVVGIDGAVLYTKGLKNQKHPQPTPAEIEELVETLFPDYPCSEDERCKLAALHSAQIEELNQAS